MERIYQIHSNFLFPRIILFFILFFIIKGLYIFWISLFYFLSIFSDFYLLIPFFSSLIFFSFVCDCVFPALPFLVLVAFFSFSFSDLLPFSSGFLFLCGFFSYFILALFTPLFKFVSMAFKTRSVNYCLPLFDLDILYLLPAIWFIIWILLPILRFSDAFPKINSFFYIINSKTIMSKCFSLVLFFSVFINMITYRIIIFNICFIFCNMIACNPFWSPFSFVQNLSSSFPLLIWPSLYFIYKIFLFALNAFVHSFLCISFFLYFPFCLFYFNYLYFSLW